MTLDMKPASIITAELGIQKGGRIHKYFTHRCRVHMNKYIPMSNLKSKGDLRTIVDEQPTYIVYESPYAHAQYVGYTTGPVKHYTTPGTGPHWDRRMWAAEGDIVVREVQNYINRGG